MPLDQHWEESPRSSHLEEGVCSAQAYPFWCLPPALSFFLPSLPVAMNFIASPDIFLLTSALITNLDFPTVLETFIFTSLSSRLLLIEHF